MTQPKQPQDRKPKADQAGDECFSFTHRGKVYTFEKPTTDALRPAFLRANRRRTALDFEFTTFELLAGDDALDAIDEMSREEYAALSRDFRTHSQGVVGVSTGESSAS